jgi:polyhydroxyalkanoate synthesis regulator protein
MEQALIPIRRYAGERLYDTLGARCVSSDDIRIMTAGGMHIVIVGAADARDVTREIGRGPSH